MLEVMSFLEEIQALHIKPIYLFSSAMSKALDTGNTGAGCCQNQSHRSHLSLLETLILVQFISTALWQPGKTSVTRVLPFVL